MREKFRVASHGLAVAWEHCDRLLLFPTFHACRRDHLGDKMDFGFYLLYLFRNSWAPVAVRRITRMAEDVWGRRWRPTMNWRHGRTRAVSELIVDWYTVYRVCCVVNTARRCVTLWCSDHCRRRRKRSRWRVILSISVRSARLTASIAAATEPHRPTAGQVEAEMWWLTVAFMDSCIHQTVLK